MSSTLSTETNDNFNEFCPNAPIDVIYGNDVAGHSGSFCDFRNDIETQSIIAKEP